MPRFINLVGRRFGRLVVVARAANAGCGHTRWDCRCDCGGAIVTRALNLRAGDTQSCGCLHIETARARWRSHGLSKTPIYKLWAAMISRCNNPRNKAFKHYGARGIRVCERWRNSFECFLADMGEPPPRMTLERKNRDSDYSPDNCLWATWTEQNRNTSRNRVVTHGGLSMTLAEWSETLGLPYGRLKNRLYRNGTLTTKQGVL